MKDFLLRIFGRQKKIKEEPVEDNLPPSFAQNVLELETSLDFNCTLEVVNKLMELYTQAIEYYESIQNHNYLHYQERMHSILMRPDVIQILHRPKRLTPPRPEMDPIIKQKRKV